MVNENKTISWSAPEFRHYHKNIGWYVSFVAIVILLIGFFVIEKDLFAAVSMGILGILMGLFSFQKPQIVEVELTAKSVRFGNVHFSYKHLKYFWIVNNENHKTLNFEASTFIHHTIIIELMDQNEDEIRSFLLAHLPEHHQTTETFAQKVSHKLKF